MNQPASDPRPGDVDPDTALEDRLDALIGPILAHSTFYDRDGNPITAGRYAMLNRDPTYVRVARHRVVRTGDDPVDVELSTAWVGETGGSERGEDGLPRVFETILFPSVPTAEIDVLAGSKWRTATEADALKAHGILLEVLCRLVTDAVVTEVPLPVAQDAAEDAAGAGGE